MSVRILRAADRTPAAWKNGGGVTWEIAAFPDGAGLAGFDWRMSLARVAAGGPFSTFPGVDRLMLVLGGALELEIAGAGRLRLDAASAAAEFPGDADVRALTPAAPVTDLNVMVRRGRFIASLERRRVAGSAVVVCQDATLILCRAPGEAVTGAECHELGVDDVIRLDGMRGTPARLRLTGEVAIAHVNAVR
jgi:hypothetical protein